MGEAIGNTDALRAFALGVLRCYPDLRDLHEGALLALAEAPIPADWRPWQEVTDAAEDQWFAWRDPAGLSAITADRVMTDGAGRIENKFDCGLDVYPMCQPLRFAEDVRQVLAKFGMA